MVKTKFGCLGIISCALNIFISTIIIIFKILQSYIKKAIMELFFNMNILVVEDRSGKS